VESQERLAQLQVANERLQAQADDEHLRSSHDKAGGAAGASAA
jgi:hypothetical protein